MPWPFIALEVLAAEQGVHEVREHEQRNGEPEGVGGRHQTRSSTQRIRYANAKHVAAIAIAARSYISKPRYGDRAEAALKIAGRKLKKP